MSLTETLLALALILPCFIGGGSLIVAEWRQVRCLHRSFNLAHDRLVGKPGLPDWRARTQEDEESVEVELRCRGGGTERVRLLKLEAVPWNRI